MKCGFAAHVKIEVRPNGRSERMFLLQIRPRSKGIYSGYIFWSDSGQIWKGFPVVTDLKMRFSRARVTQNDKCKIETAEPPPKRHMFPPLISAKPQDVYSELVLAHRQAGSGRRESKVGSSPNRIWVTESSGWLIAKPDLGGGKLQLAYGQEPGFGPWEARVGLRPDG